MERKFGLKLVAWSLAVLVVAVLAPAASASVVGYLSVADCSGGGVIVSATLIDWQIGSPQACFQVGINTDVTSVGDGTLTAAAPDGTINDLPSLLPQNGDAGFMTFGNFKFDLALVGGFGPGSTTDCAVNPGLNNSCSISGTSPFLLTQTSTGTSVTLLAHGTIFDIGDSATTYWGGSFTTQITGQLPAAIETTINGGGHISSSFSGEFDIGAPEPVSMALIGGGLIGLAAIKRRKRA